MALFLPHCTLLINFPIYQASQDSKLISRVSTPTDKNTSVIIFQKCDGTLPVCNRCIQSGHTEDCEYTNESEPARTHILEKQISQLEARVRELQGPNASSSGRASPRQHLGRPLHIQSSRDGEIASAIARPQVSPSTSLLPHTFRLPTGWWESVAPPPQISKFLYVYKLTYNHRNPCSCS